MYLDEEKTSTSRKSVVVQGVEVFSPVPTCPIALQVRNDMVGEYPLQKYRPVKLHSNTVGCVH